MQDDSINIRSGYGFDYEIAIAGLGARSYAFTIDWHVRILVALLWVAVTQWTIRLTGSDSPLFHGISIIPAVVFYLFYHPIIELIMEGNSPGKRYAGIKVVMDDGSVPPKSAIMIRNVMRIIDSMPVLYMVGMASCFVTRQQIRIGDMAAGTVLVYESERNNLTENVELYLDNDQYSIEALKTVRSLLNRWDGLGESKRIEFASSLLEKLERPVPASATSTTLREMLDEVVSDSGKVAK